MNDDKFLTIPEAMSYCGVRAKSTLWKYSKTGILPPPSGIGRKGYWQSQLDAMLNRPANQTKPEASQSVAKR